MKQILLGLVMTLGVLQDGFAQAISPGATQERSTDTRKYYSTQEQLGREPPTARQPDVIEGKPEAASPSPKLPAQTIFIKKIEVDRSEILSEAELRAIIQPLENRKDTFEQLSKAVEAINALYRKKGFITARAFLPPQKIVNGVVRIKLVEGRVGSVKVENNRHTKSSYIRKRILARQGDLVDLGKLEKEIVYFNGTNDVKIRALLEPGEEFGTSDYIIKAHEPSEREFTFTSDNAGRKEIGLYRTGANYTEKSLTGHRDRLTLGGYRARGTNDAHIAYNFPVTASGARLGISYEYSRIRIVEGTIADLKVTGKSSALSSFISQPLVATRRSSVNIFAGYNVKHSETLSGQTALLGTNVHAVVAGIDHLSRSDTWSFYGRHNFVSGRDISSDKRAFFNYGGEYSAFIVLGRYHLIWRARLQLSDSTSLPSQEQIQIGGASSVRGYQEGYLIGDNGYYMSTELSIPGPTEIRPAWLGRFLGGRLRWFVFADEGQTFTLKHSGATDAHKLLLSTGAGLSLEGGEHFFGRLTLGVPLKHYDENRHPRLQFYAQYQF